MKKLLYLCIILILATACSGGHNAEADRLYNDAEAAISARQYARALTLIDSLNNAFPGELELRKRANFLRARALQSLYSDSLAITDSLIIQTGIYRDSLARSMRWVNNEIEGFYIVSPSTLDDAVSVRLSPEKVMYLVLHTSGNPSTMTFTGPEGTNINIAVPKDAYLNNTDGKGRTITIMGDQVRSVAEMAAANPGAEIKLNGKPLGAERCRALANAYNITEAERTLQALVPKRTRMEQIIETAQRQAAQTVTDTIPNH